MNVDSIALNSLVLCIPLRLVVLYPLEKTGENKNKCQVPGGRSLAVVEPSTALWESGWGRRVQDRWKGWRLKNIYLFNQFISCMRCTFRQGPCALCAGEKERGQHWSGGEGWKDLDGVFCNDEVRETWGHQLRQTLGHMKLSDHNFRCS